MKKAIVALLIMALGLVLVGCGSSDSQSFRGLVFAMEDGQVLVIQDIESVDIPYEDWFEEGKRAIWFSISKKTAIRNASGKKTATGDIKVGQEVEVHFSGAVMKSYPEQAGADKIIIISEPLRL